MNSIYKALNNIFILTRNTVSMFLPLKEIKVSEDLNKVDTYPHKHMSTSTATDSYYVFTKDSYPKSYPYDLQSKTPFSSVKIKNNSNNIWSSRTDIAILRLRKAVNNKGPNPNFHNKIMKKHRSEWPELWVAIDALLKADE
jgi:hypothetical protein